MTLNPYESPPVSSSKASPDLLKYPAIAAVITSALAIGFAILYTVGSVIVIIQVGDEDLAMMLLDELKPMTLYLLFGILGLIAARGMHQRRWRWLITIWAIWATVTCMLAPVGVIVLMRVWRKDAWKRIDSSGYNYGTLVS